MLLAHEVGHWRSGWEPLAERFRGGEANRVATGRVPQILRTRTEQDLMEANPGSWAEMEFGTCELGDRRRTQRLVKVGTQALARPDGTSPEQAESWADCKALYRLMNCDEVSFEAITLPHFERTRRSGEIGQIRLILNDTTEIDYGGKRRARGLGPVGRNTGRGFFLHSGLMRDPVSGEVIGLAGQKILYRKSFRTRSAGNSRRRDPERESVIWGQLIDAIGSPPPGVKWLHVCDQAADDYEVFLHANQQGCGWVIRACRHNRLIVAASGATLALEQHLAEQRIRGHQTLDIVATGTRPARTAKLELRFASLALPIPSVTNAWIRRHAPAEPLPMWVVELRESHPPVDVEPVHWVLLTSERVETVEQARQVIDYYSQRWGIEEYHKALKTGCRVEARYYATAPRLERVTGLLAIVAVQLLRLRHLANQAPDTSAHDVVPSEWVTALAGVRRRSVKEVSTISQFVKHLAGLGGHLGRKSDGTPGWMTLWRGLEKLLLILRGTHTANNKCG